MARELHPGKKNSLDALCERYAVDHSKRTLHGALLDAQLLAEVWLAMTRGQESLDISAAASPGASVLPRRRPCPRARCRWCGRAKRNARATRRCASASSARAKDRCLWMHLATA